MRDPVGLAGCIEIALTVRLSTSTTYDIITNRAKIALFTGLFYDASRKAHVRHQGRVPLVGDLAWLTAVYMYIGVIAAFRLLTSVSDPALLWQKFISWLHRSGLS